MAGSWDLMDEQGQQLVSMRSMAAISAGVRAMVAASAGVRW